MSEPAQTNPQVETRYFMVQGAAQPVAGIMFNRYDVIASVLYGIYATDNPKEIEAILAEPKKRGVSEISESEYSSILQKKIPGSSNSAAFRPHPVITQPKESPLPAPPAQTLSPIKGNGAVVDPNPTPPVVEAEALPASAPVATVQDALPVGEVAASPTNPPRASRKGASASKPS